MLGGSSLGMGVSAEEIFMKTKTLTLNSGLHGGLGFRGFFITAKDVINKKEDIIVISPEFSLPSNDNFLKRSDVFCEVNLFVLKKYYLKCLGYTINKIIRIYPVIDRDENSYTIEGFNEYGDYVLRENKSPMDWKNSKNSICKNINLEDLKNNYIPFYKKLKSEGYKIIYIPNFIPRISCTNDEKLKHFHKLMFKSFGVEGFRNVNQKFEEKFFYDSNYHLTNLGVKKKKTKIFISHLKKYKVNE